MRMDKSDDNDDGKIVTLQAGGEEEEKRSAVCVADAILATVELLAKRLQSESPTVVTEALVDIVDLLSDPERDPKAIAQAARELEAPAIIVSCMKKWMDNEDVQDWALWCIHRLASQNEDVRLEVVTCGGAEVIVSSMKLFPSTPDIQRGGCLALADTLSSPVPSAAKNLASSLVKEWDVVGMVLIVMKKWPDDAAMQVAAIRLLCHLSVVKEAPLQMIKKNATNRVSKALDNFPTDECIKAQAEPFMKTMLKTMFFSQKGKEVAQAVGRKSRSPTRTQRHTVSFAPSPLVSKGLEAMHASAPDLACGSDRDRNQEELYQPSSLAKRRVSFSSSLAGDLGWNHQGKVQMKASNLRNLILSCPDLETPDLEDTRSSDWTHYEDQAEQTWPGPPKHASSSPRTSIVPGLGKCVTSSPNLAGGSDCKQHSHDAVKTEPMGLGQQVSSSPNLAGLMARAKASVEC